MDDRNKAVFRKFVAREQPMEIERKAMSSIVKSGIDSAFGVNVVQDDLGEVAFCLEVKSETNCDGLSQRR